MTDKEYVRAHWDRVSDFEGIPRIISTNYPQMTVFKNWAEAAEFTSERLEQIRQLEADIEWVRGMSDTPDAVLMMALLNVSRPDVALVWTRELCASVRTIARLESALADLRRGMK